MKRAQNVVCFLFINKKSDIVERGPNAHGVNIIPFQYCHDLCEQIGVFADVVADHTHLCEISVHSGLCNLREILMEFLRVMFAVNRTGK